MKVAEADILIVPGYGDSGDGHWQTRWEQRLSTARRVEQADWNNPVLDHWTARIVREVSVATRPVVFIAHSLGVPSVLHALPRLGPNIAGAFFVAPPDLSDASRMPEGLTAFGPYPTERLPFPAITIASRNDPYCAFETAERLTESWGSLLIDAGESGHLNTESGHGPWPEGTMVFAEFLSRLQAPLLH
ncbi:alpha/beta hydrolase [Rhizobiaceae bacterium BDR2-2]|uniref:Alpha/beta hydrolase n=1 Tax=Ectorhizobium quercum TaxID=2965071 RepID=A0AAE3MZ93_9HYPH|nr:alpha/beta hydrolase [Ectorhizobium quercum]MCX8997813.1 alpha/beta hydrolase [Ectorhizobium quercum]